MRDSGRDSERESERMVRQGGHAASGAVGCEAGPQGDAAPDHLCGSGANSGHPPPRPAPGPLQSLPPPPEARPEAPAAAPPLPMAADRPPAFASERARHAVRETHGGREPEDGPLWVERPRAVGPPGVCRRPALSRKGPAAPRYQSAVTRGVIPLQISDRGLPIASHRRPQDFAGFGHHLFPQGVNQTAWRRTRYPTMSRARATASRAAASASAPSAGPKSSQGVR